MNTQAPAEYAASAARQLLIAAHPAVIADPDFSQQVDNLAHQIETQGWRAVIAAVFALPQARFSNHHSDLYIGCLSWAEAYKIRTGGPWRSMASTFTPLPGSSLSVFPCAVCIPFGNLQAVLRPA